MNWKYNILMGLLALFIFSFISCGDDNNTIKDSLTGTINIGGTMEVGEEAIANIVSSNGTAGKFTYQWTQTKDCGTVLEIVGENGERYTITEADVGHKLGATVSNEDTTGTISGVSTDKVKFGGRTEALQIGGGETVVNITLEYREDDTTSVGKIGEAVTLFQTAFESENSTHVAAINNLINVGVGGYIIVVDYEEDASVTGLRATNNNTIKVSKAWLDTNPTFNANTLRNALNSMLIWVDPDDA